MAVEQFNISLSRTMRNMYVPSSVDKPEERGLLWRPGSEWDDKFAPGLL
jgi:hypothetical protein